MSAPDSQYDRELSALRDLPPPRDLTEGELERIEREIVDLERKGRRRGRSNKRWLVLAPALLAPLAFAAALPAIREWRERRGASGSASASAPVAPQPSIVPVAPEPETKASEENAQAPVASSAPKRLRNSSNPQGGRSRKKLVAVAALEESEDEGSLEAEARLMGEALTMLRQQSRPADALAVLNRYREQFPAGQLRRESEVARVDALLALNRRPQALAELNRMGSPRPGTPRAEELRVLRAELLNESGSAAEAISILDPLLRSVLPPAVEERALVARAAALTATGQADEGREDLRRYLDRFPNGRFAAAARATLRGR